MLIEFNVSNFLSFAEEKAFSMVTANSVKEHSKTNIFIDPHKNKLLKVAAIYGNNASGKSNLIRSFSVMKNFVIKSFQLALQEGSNEINLMKFKLNKDYEKKPTCFEIIFSTNKKRYRYGFEISSNKIETEWLFCIENKKEISLFTRDGNSYNYHKTAFKEGKDVFEKTKNNVLLLTIAAHFNGEISNEIIKWFKNIQIITAINDDGYGLYTINLLEKDKKFRKWVTEVVDFLGIVDITLEENTTLEHLKEAKIDIKNKTLKKFINLITELEQDLKINKVKKLVTWHNVYKDNEVIGTVPFDFHNEESQGTIKFISLLGPIYDTLKTGRILIIDELDSRLHPILTQKVIEIFQKTNKTKAQLIFASHDVTLLNKNIFRRDQIWFAEKTFEGATDLYSLVEYKEYKARKDATFEKEYLQGKYGALPLLSNLEESFYKIHE